MVWAPPYTNGSAGVRVLHRLCHWLLELGEDAVIASASTNPAWKACVWDGVVRPGDVAVYPEIVSGNVYQAARVVRYVLNHPGLLGGEPRYEPGDHVVYYEPAFRASASAAAGVDDLGEERELRISVLESELFYRGDGPRVRDCVYVGKGHANRAARPIDESGMRSIAAGDPAERAELAELLRSTRTLYTYDPNTSLALEAYLCGVAVQIVTASGIVPFTTDPTQVPSYEDGSHVGRFVSLVKARWS